MTFKELEQKMAQLRETGQANDLTDVFICQTNDEYPNSLLEHAEMKSIVFKADGVPDAEEVCFRLTDEI